MDSLLPVPIPGSTIVTDSAPLRGAGGLPLPFSIPRLSRAFMDRELVFFHHPDQFFPESGSNAGLSRPNPDGFTFRMSSREESVDSLDLDLEVDFVLELKVFSARVLMLPFLVS